MLGIAFFGCSTVFQAVTLPVEFNASHRALAALEKRRHSEPGRAAWRPQDPAGRCAAPMWRRWPSPWPSCCGCCCSLAAGGTTDMAGDARAAALAGLKAQRTQGDMARPICEKGAGGSGGLSRQDTAPLAVQLLYGTLQNRQLHRFLHWPAILRANCRRSCRLVLDCLAPWGLSAGLPRAKYRPAPPSTSRCAWPGAAEAPRRRGLPTPYCGKWRPTGTILPPGGPGGLCRLFVAPAIPTPFGLPSVCWRS